MASFADCPPFGEPLAPPSPDVSPTGAPTRFDIARALATHISTAPSPPPHVVTYNLGLVRNAAARYGNRSSGGSVLGLANSLHAQLYGLPVERPALPGALDELLQATGIDDDHTIVLEQVAAQLEAAVELIKRARYTHGWQLPEHVTIRLGMSEDVAQHLAGELRELAPSLKTGEPSTPVQAVRLPPRPAAVPRPARR